MLAVQCSAALNQRQTAASNRTREKSGIEFIYCDNKGEPQCA